MSNLDLQNTTFIISLRIDHLDRYHNAKSVLRFMNKHLNTNVYIYEVSDDGESRLDFLSDLNNLNIKIINQKYDGVFHRMHYLNVLLNQVNTPVVCNYDIDVVLLPETYLNAQTKILNKEWDMLFPYEFGNAQNQIHRTYRRDLFEDHFNLQNIPSEHITTNHGSEFGHCVFINAEVYKKGGGENENFVSWGPEDKERAFRFRALGYKVGWMPKTNVWHFEHARGADSSNDNPYLQNNWSLYDQITKLTPAEMLQYYQSQQYIKQYDNFLYPE